MRPLLPGYPFAVKVFKQRNSIFAGNTGKFLELPDIDGAAAHGIEFLFQVGLKRSDARRVESSPSRISFFSRRRL